MLAAGVEGPLAEPYRWAFDHVPLFQAMREQGKWLALPVMGYAVGFGAGVEYLEAWLRTHLTRRSVSIAFGVAVGAIPLVIAPALLWGLGNTVHTSQYPASWYAADARMGSGDGQVLFLPWHGYQPFAFTDGRTVATPAQAFFRRNVLASDAVELPAVRTDSTSLRTAYVDKLVAGAGFGAFGDLVAPLGIEYVVVAHNAAANNYSWVQHQTGLTLVSSSPTLDLYKVAVAATGRVVTGRLSTFGGVIAAVKDGTLGTTATLKSGPAGFSAPASQRYGEISKDSSVQWHVNTGAAGWVVIPEEFASGWKAHTSSGISLSGHPTVAGAIAFDLPSSAVTITFQPWTWLLPALGLSVLFLLALLGAGVVEHRREVRELIRTAPST